MIRSLFFIPVMVWLFLIEQVQTRISLKNTLFLTMQTGLPGIPPLFQWQSCS